VAGRQKQSDLARSLAAESPEVAELRDALRRSQQELAIQKRRAQHFVHAVYSAARDAAMAMGRAPVVPRPVRDRRQKSEEVALLHTTDWQVGKETKSYNSEVAHERIAVQMMDKVDQITEIERSDHPVREAHCLLGGDMVEGITIFPGQAYQVDSTLFVQLFNAARIVEEVIRRLLANFDVVHAYEEYGNHGRIGRKGELPSRDNLDLMAYRIARGVLQKYIDDGRLVWHETEDFYNIVKAGNYRAMLAHGDEIKSFGGNLPSFGIRRKTTSWAAGAINDFFGDVYLGHFHIADVIQLPNGWRAFITPSPESDNDYAKEFVASAGTPAQRLHYVDPAKGRVTSERILWLDAGLEVGAPSYPDEEVA